MCMCIYIYVCAYSCAFVCVYVQVVLHDTEKATHTHTHTRSTCCGVAAGRCDLWMSGGRLPCCYISRRASQRWGPRARCASSITLYYTPLGTRAQAHSKQQQQLIRTVTGVRWLHLFFVFVFCCCSSGSSCRCSSSYWFLRLCQWKCSDLTGWSVSILVFKLFSSADVSQLSISQKLYPGSSVALIWRCLHACVRLPFNMLGK